MKERIHKGRGHRQGEKEVRDIEGLTAEERQAMKERIQELRLHAKASSSEEIEGAVLERIRGWPEPDRAMGARLHHLIKSTAPELSAKLWYGMPAYARQGNIICFFQPAHKFRARYATIGFTDNAKLDEGFMWPIAFALKRLTKEEEARIAELVRRAVRG